MATHFSNVVNIQSTREQVDLFFGTNQTWNATDERPLSIELSNRLILSPFAAKAALAGAQPRAARIRGSLRRPRRLTKSMSRRRPAFR